MVGNDVVDLGDPETLPEGRHPRFDCRVFTLDECRMIQNDRNPNALRWTLWACKESTYKLLKRSNPRTIFSPKTFEVTFWSPATWQIQHRGKTTYAEVSDHGDCLHAIAAWIPAEIPSVVSSVEMTRTDPSSTVRELARRRLAPVLGCLPERIEIVSASDRIPEVHVDGTGPCGYISLSHHGRFVAFSWRK
jgi:phosphopantetheinyl transferase (holo-ACP synthase)